MINTNLYNWKDNKLYLGKKSTGYAVFLDFDHPNEKLYRVKYPDGTSSADFYNLSWAKEHCISEASIHFKTSINGTEKAVDAFK